MSKRLTVCRRTAPRPHPIDPPGAGQPAGRASAWATGLRRASAWATGLCRPPPQVDHLGQAIVGLRVHDHVDITAPCHLPHAAWEILDRQPHLPRPGLVAEQRQTAHPQPRDGGLCKRQPGDARRGDDRREGQHRQPSPTEDPLGPDLPKMGGRFGGCTGQERRIDIHLRLIGQFDRRRQAVAKRRMGTFHDDRQARIAKIRGQPPEQLSIKEDGKPDRGRGQQHPARPSGRLHAPVERERHPEKAHGREDEPGQRFQPDPAAGLPAQGREHRSQARHVGGGLPAFGSRDRRRWIDDERHDRFSAMTEQ